MAFDLAAERRRLTEQVRADLEEASRFVAKGDYLQGLVYLKRVAELEHPRFADAARRAKAKIEQIKGERDRRTEEAQTLVERRGNAFGAATARAR